MLSSLKSFPDIPLAIKYPIIVKTITTIADIIIIFTAVKSAPLIRIYDGDDEKITSNILNTILDFEDKRCIYNSYYSKYDYYTEERKITNISNGIEAMK